MSRTQPNREQPSAEKRRRPWITLRDQGSLLAKVANSSMSDVQKINYLYRAGLSRSPTKNERMKANQALAFHQGNVKTALQDIWWAVLNSNEFIMNH